MTRAVTSLLLALLVTPPTASALRVEASFLREAEKKHARVAMLALPTLLALQAAGVDSPAGWLASQPVDTQIDFFSGAGVVESALTLPRYRKGFRLREGVYPGGIFRTEEAPPAADLAEDLVGRASMLAATVFLLSDVATA